MGPTHLGSSAEQLEPAWRGPVDGAGSSRCSGMVTAPGVACGTLERKGERLFLDRSSARWLAFVEIYPGANENEC